MGRMKVWHWQTKNGIEMGNCVKEVEDKEGGSSRDSKDDTF